MPDQELVPGIDKMMPSDIVDSIKALPTAEQQAQVICSFKPHDRKRVIILRTFAFTGVQRLYDIAKVMAFADRTAFLDDLPMAESTQVRTKLNSPEQPKEEIKLPGKLGEIAAAFGITTAAGLAALLETFQKLTQGGEMRFPAFNQEDLIAKLRLELQNSGGLGIETQALSGVKRIIISDASRVELLRISTATIGRAMLVKISATNLQQVGRSIGRIARDASAITNDVTDGGSFDWGSAANAVLRIAGEGKDTTENLGLVGLVSQAITEVGVGAEAARRQRIADYQQAAENNVRCPNCKVGRGMEPICSNCKQKLPEVQDLKKFIEEFGTDPSAPSAL